MPVDDEAAALHFRVEAGFGLQARPKIREAWPEILAVGRIDARLRLVPLDAVGIDIILALGRHLRTATAADLGKPIDRLRPARRLPDEDREGGRHKSLLRLGRFR